MVRNIIFTAITFYTGYKVGVYLSNRIINNRIKTLRKIERTIKEQNNRMVNNFAVLYGMTEHNEAEFTEIDAMLASMWMD